jgi:hypothetical protein
MATTQIQAWIIEVYMYIMYFVGWIEIYFKKMFPSSKKERQQQQLEMKTIIPNNTFGAVSYSQDMIFTEKQVNDVVAFVNKTGCTLFLVSNANNDCLVQIQRNYKRPDIPNVLSEMYANTVITPADFTFISIQMTYQNNSYDILLSRTGKYNYYVVGNKLNKHFFFYFLNKHYGVQCSSLNDPYTILLIDESCNTLYLSEDSIIQIHKLNYVI